MSNTADAPSTLKSAEKMFTIVECLQRHGETGVTQIAVETGFPKSTVHAHLTTLEQNDYVVKDEGAYRLGLRFLEHGMRARDQLLVSQVASSTLKQVAEETGEMVWLVVEEHGLAVYVKKAVGDRAVQTHPRMGKRLHLHYLAAGKAILAELGDERVQEIIDRHGLPDRSENTITDPDLLFEELAEISDRGVAFNRGEELRGVRAVGAPIVHSGEVWGSISVSGPTKRMTGERFHDTLPEIVQGATNEVELRLAYELNGGQS